MIKECNHRWHFMEKETNWTYVDSGETFLDGEKIDGYQMGPTYVTFICDKCLKTKKRKLYD